ncbi:hypothetical protein [Halosolutus gelatinilyticus]|uniref:hypothetical protein n=1 Tax=Halosolutus gelatinilyticus TaxID=2931975 RepID=UPI001FF504B1|nr:hypothetical protein [Halosolutus gelatinilyticus]
MAVTESVQEATDELDRRALTQYMTVLEDVSRVRGCDGQYLVISQPGSEYLVDARLGVCECPDYRFRSRECKHLKRGAYATGQREIPAIIDRDDLDEQLGEHCSGTLR